MSKIGLKIKNLRKKGRFSQASLGKLLGVSGSQVGYYESGENDTPQDILVKLAELFEISVGSLVDDKLDLDLTGAGNSNTTAKEERERYRRAGMIPLYDTVAVGGSDFLKADESAVTVNNFEWIHAGPFVGRATGAIRHYGDSMYEKFPSGCIIAYAGAPDWREYLHYGSDYVVETRDGYRVTKNIQPKNEDKILLVSHNTYKNKHGVEIYSPYTVPMKMFRSMSYVLGMVRFDASMQAFAVVEEQNK
jgi:transcriptional regulator with XRE-family HTH domain